MTEINIIKKFLELTSALCKHPKSIIIILALAIIFSAISYPLVAVYCFTCLDAPLVNAILLFILCLLGFILIFCLFWLLKNLFKLCELSCQENSHSIAAPDLTF